MNEIALNEMILKPQRKAGHFLTVGFLSFWLCGWFAGEVGALVALFKGTWVFVQGDSDSASMPLAGGGAFLILWLSLWTFGGYAAVLTVLRLALGRDRIEWSSGGVAIHHRPLGRRRFFARAQIREVAERARDGAVLLRLTAGNVEVTSMGTVDERRQLLGALRASLDLNPSAPLQAPESWEPVSSDDGWAVLSRSATFKKNQVRALAVLAGLIGAFAAVLLVAPHQSTPTRLFGAVTALVAYACGWWAHRLANTDTSLRARAGTLVRRSVIHGDDVRDEVFRIEALAVNRASDGDGGDWYHLELRTATATTRILSSSTDADDPVTLGRWLEQHTGVRLAVCEPELALRPGFVAQSRR